VDAAGNVEARKSATFTITVPDTTAPVTTSDAQATYVSSAAIKLSATDNVGVTATYFTLDGGAQTSGTTINVAAAGSHTIQFWSVDAAGNVEARKSATFTITIPLPVGTMTIADGAAQVGSPDVTIASAVTGADEMRFDAGAGAFGSWMTYASTAHVTLAGGYGTNMVRVEYRNAGGTLQLMGLIDLIEVVTPVDPPVVPVDPPVVPPVDPPVVPTQTVIPTATLGTSTTTLAYGSTATLRISVVPAASTLVRVEKRTGTSQWSSVTTLTTDASGNAQLAVTPLVATSYRVVIASTGGVSNTVTITVSARVTIHSSRKIVHRTSTVTLSGVASASSGSTVLLQRSVNGAWKTLRSISTSSAGRYAARVGFTKRGSYVYRIAVRTRAHHVSFASATLRIRVR
jgi:5-hydroxyisourate hydrolase-like protein (transthyretin family)